MVWSYFNGEGVKGIESAVQSKSLVRDEWILIPNTHVSISELANLEASPNAFFFLHMIG